MLEFYRKKPSWYNAIIISGVVGMIIYAVRFFVYQQEDSINIALMCYICFVLLLDIYLRSRRWKDAST